MANYNFTDVYLGSGVLSGFDPSSDTLTISNSASYIRGLGDDGLDTTILIAGGASIVVEGVLAHQFTNANLLAINGSSFYIGDDDASSDISGDNTDTTISRSGFTTNDAIFTFGGNDSVTGGSGWEFISLGSGDDTVVGGGGRDTFIGGAGNDFLRSGSLDYSTSPSSVYVDPRNKTASDGFGTTDVIEQIQDITGSQYNDTIIGEINGRYFGLGGDDVISTTSAGADIFGGAGNDHIRGHGYGGLGESLNGGSGNDTILGLGGNDTLVGGSGADILDGGASSDTASYEFGNSGLIAILDGRYSIYNAGDAAIDILLNIENLWGTSNDDFLGGDDNSNIISGFSGNDQLFGLGGSDTLNGDLGDDTLNGGAGADTLNGLFGSDTASYKVLSGAVTASLANPNKNTGQADGDQYNSIENLEGSFGKDSLEGDNNANIVWGVGNTDTLSGLGGDDTLDGGARADVLNGGSGFDYASYESSGVGVTAILLGGYEYLATGHAANDSYTSIEGLIGSNRDDILAGNNGANEILGLAGNDFLIGVNGNDTLDGGVGNDTLNGGLPFNPNGFGSDRFVFKTGYDNDTIDGFAAGAGSEDIIALSLGTSFDTFGEIQGAASDVGGNTLLSFGGGDSLTLIGVNSNSLHQDDFVFV